ncbi:MAG TPA: hypothetical protein VM533_17035 [Fimbriiglobus sp.]|jgi:hypothetical protein|nr:hypothetical protein [Fimbriiglobus sp.]
MKRIASLALVLAVGVAIGCVGPADGTPAAAEEPPAADKPKPPAEEGKDVPPALAELMNERSKLHKRQTGALLTIQAKSEKAPEFVPAVEIGWSIDYDGPRHPFAILAPSLSIPAADQTVLHFWYVGAFGRPVPVKIAAGVSEGIPPPKGKESYAISVGGKPATGDPIVTSWRELSRFARRAFRPGEAVLFQLEHVPTDRGNGYEWVIGPPPHRQVSEGPAWTLDAWTGQLWSQPVVLTAIPSSPPR